MTLSAKEMAELETRGRLFGKNRNDDRYLAHALKGVASGTDPVDVLDVLRAMFGTGHGRRPDEKEALNRVGVWLEARLSRDPRVGVERLALELGWLKRFAKIYEEKDDPRNKSPDRGPDPRGKRSAADGPKFGRTLDALRVRRRGSGARQEQQAPRARQPHPEPPRVTELPATFRARFADFPTVRHAHKTAAERRKKGKEPKSQDTQFAIVPEDQALVALGKRLWARLADTGGIDDYIHAVAHEHHGSPQPFAVAAHEAQPDGSVRVLRISTG